MAGPAPKPIKPLAPKSSMLSRSQNAPRQMPSFGSLNSSLALVRAVGNNATILVKEQEETRRQQAVPPGTEFDRLPPEEKARLSTPLRERAAATQLSNYPDAQAPTTEPEQSTFATVMEGAGTVGSWLVGHGELNAWRDSNALPVGAQLAAEACAPQRDFRKIADKLDAEDMPDRVAFGFMQSALITDTWLDLMAKSPDGRYLLNHVYVQLVEGATGPIEGLVRGLIPLPLMDRTNKIMKHGARIMDALSRAVPVESFAKAASDKSKLKIFPFKLQGLTTFSQTPMNVKLSPEGKVMIELWTHLPGDYPDEYKTLPPEIISKAIAIEPDEIVGIRLYDEGGLCIFRPAIYLLHLDQQYMQDTIATVQLSAGLGSAVGGASAAGLKGAAKVLGHIDHAVMALGLLSKIINEHRWWLEDQGLGGFLVELEFLNSAAQIYGLGRLVTSAPQLLRGVHESYDKWRERRALMTESLPVEQQSLLKSIDDHVKNIPNPVRPNPAPQEPPTASSPTPPAAPKPKSTNDFDNTASLSPEAQKQLELIKALAGKPLFTGPEPKPRPTPPDVPQAHVIDFLSKQKKTQSSPPAAQVEIAAIAPERVSDLVPAERPNSPRSAEINAASQIPAEPRAGTSSAANESTSAPQSDYGKFTHVEQEVAVLQKTVDELARKITDDQTALRALSEKRFERRNELKRHMALEQTPQATIEKLQREFNAIEVPARKLEKRLEANANKLRSQQQQLKALSPFSKLGPPTPGETPAQLADRWFGQLRNESLSDYAKRIEGCESDVMSIVTEPGKAGEWNVLHERWQAALRQARARHADLQLAQIDRTTAFETMRKVEREAAKSVSGSTVFEKLKQARLEASIAQERVNRLEYGMTTGQFAETVVRERLPSEFTDPRAAQKAGGQGVDLLADQKLTPKSKALAVMEVKGTASDKPRPLSTAQQQEKPYVVDRLLDSANNGSQSAEETLARLQAGDYEDIRFYKADVTGINLKTGERNLRPLQARGSMSIDEFKQLVREWHLLGQQKFKQKYGLLDT